MEKQRKGQEWLKQLNLTTDQQTQIQAIRDQEKTASADLLKQMKAAHEKMQSLMASASAGQLRQQHEQVQGLRQQLDDRRFESMLKIREILTPEQRTKMAALKTPRHGRHRGLEPQS